MNRFNKVYEYKSKIFRKCPDLIQRIKDRNFYPLKVEIHLPPKTKELCWLKCKHCYTQGDINENQKISEQRVIELINEISNGSPINNKKPYQIILSGFRTDPLNSNYFDSVLKYSIEKNFSFGVHTKGIVLSEESIDNLIHGNSEEDYISFSMDAGDNKTYNLVHDIKNPKSLVFSRVVRNIEKLVNEKEKINSNLNIRATYLLTNENSGDSVDSFIKIFSDIGVDTIRFSVPIYPKMGNQDRKTIHEEISEKKLKELEDFFLNIKKENEKIVYLDFPSSSERVLPCFTRHIFPTIGYEGYLYPCCSVASKEFEILRIADLKEQSFWESFYKIKYLDYISANCQCDRNSSETNKEIFRLLNGC